jgi:hypothetical protein
VEPRVLKSQDGNFSKHGNSWVLDVGVACPGTQRCVDQGSGTTPGLATEAYSGQSAPSMLTKTLHRIHLGDGWKVYAAAREWLDTSGQAKRCPVRTTVDLGIRTEGVRPPRRRCGLGARAGSRAGEDSGGDPLHRPRCRGASVPAVLASYPDNAHVFPRCT